MENPELFANLDYAAFGSRLTHPRRLHRYLANLFYGALVLTLEIFGRNATYPLLLRSPESKRWNRLAEKINARVPFDR